MKAPDCVTLCIVDCVDKARAILALNRCMVQMDFKNVLMISSFADVTEYQHVKIEPINDKGKYCAFMLYELYKYLNTSHVLMVQHDGYILNGAAWKNSWLEYDYIGAPWWYGNDNNVGNGGFSLRSKRLCQLTADLTIPNIDNEDVLICRRYRPMLEKDHGIKYAPEEVAAEFSIEGSVEKYGNSNKARWSGQFGFHNDQWTDISAAVAI